VLGFALRKSLSVRIPCCSNTTVMIIWSWKIRTHCRFQTLTLTLHLAMLNSKCVQLKFATRRVQTTPQMFRQFLGISHYFALLKKYWLFLHQTWQKSRRPIANYIYVKNVSKCQSCDVTVMTSSFLPLLKFLIRIFFTMCSKEHIKGSWKLKKFCPYHKN